MPTLGQFTELPLSEWKLTTPIKSKECEGYKREAIRQWVLHELVVNLNFPQEWLGEQIKLLDPSNNDEQLKNIFGIIINTSKGNPFLLIIISTPGNSKSAENTLQKALLDSETIGIGIVTDGTKEGTTYLRRRFDTEKCDYVSGIEAYVTPSNVLESGLFFIFQKDDTNNSGSSLEPLSSRIENIFFELHSHIRDIDGLHADEALDELCKVLYVKMFDEEVTVENEPLKLQRRLYGTSEELASVTRALYFEANKYDTRVFRLKIPNYERSRGVFSKPIRLSSPSIVKIIDSIQRYSLTKSDSDVKGRAFQKVFVPTIRSGMGQYFTPEPVVKLMIDVTAPTINDLILDPFCGSAHFLSKALEFVRNNTRQLQSKQFHEFAFGKLHGIEKSDRMVRIAMTDMRLHGDGHSNIRCTDALLDFSNYHDLEPESFDLILTNPPFGSLLGKDAISQLGTFNLAEGKKRVPLEILGLERCLQFLRPNGKLGIILPDSILSNRNTNYVREWLVKQAKICAILSLPIETFSPFGANIKTSVIFLRKWEIGEIRSSNYSIFMARIDDIGYDATGRPKDTNELHEVTKALRTYFNEEGW